ncbi:MAG: type II toxin-antitoxin system ParD family antitoxin [Xanthobacteraceae bacterium]|nr:type II toxin-antitoxin system ParD family antitoxin [Xanthobacteraceae bacterium]
MTRKTDLAVDDYFADFIDRQVRGGRYNSASDVVQAGLRLLEEQEARLEALRAALIEGEKSGPSTEFNFDGFLERKRRERATSK